MSSQARLIRSYDRTKAAGLLRRYYEDSGFLNWGYWDAQPKSQREASEALVDKLLDKIPQKGGRILDVACGLGAGVSPKACGPAGPGEIIFNDGITELIVGRNRPAELLKVGTDQRTPETVLA
jgi:hypothetical protein